MSLSATLVANPTPSTQEHELSINIRVSLTREGIGASDVLTLSCVISAGLLLSLVPLLLIERSPLWRSEQETRHNDELRLRRAGTLAKTLADEQEEGR